MKKRTLLPLIVSLFAVGLLTGCNNANATIEDKTALSIFGKLGNFQAAKMKAGQTLTFTATPDEMYNVDQVTHNGVALKPIAKNDDGSQVFQTTLQAGNNVFYGKYAVKKSLDIVKEYKLGNVISKTVFDRVFGYTETGNDTGIDFRRSGIEKMKAPMKWSGNNKVVDKNAFVNYVDGDTTHIETANLGYTVKIRYLGINTPESTSEIEPWGLTASNYNKFLYSGDESYLNNIDDADVLKERPHGASSVILLSQPVVKGETVPEDDEHSSEIRDITEADLMIGQPLDKEGPFHATTDGYQRNLCYVWYATVKNPTINDFRCLNLEMVYQGLSLGIGSSSDTSAYTYRMFAAALNSAKDNRRHIYSTYDDTNYFYYDRYDPEDSSTLKYEVQDLTLTELYNSCTVKDDPRIGYDPSSSPFADKKTLFRIKGWVSAKVGTAFYIQENWQYDNDAVVAKTVKPHGIYVFTLRQMPIMLGDYVVVIGAISTYGGTFQIQGVNYSAAPNLNRDTVINPTGSERHKVTPIKVSGAQFNSLKLTSVLVEITDNLYFYDFKSYSSTYGNESISEGGSEEVNKYNTQYPFYNTSNTPIFYASYNTEDVDNAASIDTKYSTNSDSSAIRYTDEVIRFTINDGVTLSYGSEKCRSYKFFTGQTAYYNPKGAKYANIDETNPEKDETIIRNYTRKACKPEVAGHGLILISRAYESTGGNRKMSGEICSNSSSSVKFTAIS